MPDGDSLSIVPQMRQQQPGSRIVILSAIDAVDERINGLDAGADDYLTKPFDLDELMARIRAGLRRSGNEHALPPVRLGRLTFDLSTRVATIDGQSVIFRQKELTLLESLIRRAGRIVERETLISEIWGFDDDVQPHALTIIASRLRSRLEALDARVDLQMVRGVGYFIAGIEA
jgi:DNA-binding response OmpR family regulator